MATKSRKKASVTHYAYHGRALPVPAQAAGEELERIEARDGGVTPKALVDESRPPEAVLHPCFEWDDELAAEEYRRVQAAQIIRTVRVVQVSAAGERQRTPAYVSVPQEDGHRAYVSAARALGAEESRLVVLADALSQLRGLQNRYRTLGELAGVWQALDTVEAGQ